MSLSEPVPEGDSIPFVSARSAQHKAGSSASGQLGPIPAQLVNWTKVSIGDLFAFMLRFSIAGFLFLIGLLIAIQVINSAITAFMQGYCAH